MNLADDEAVGSRQSAIGSRQSAIGEDAGEAAGEDASAAHPITPSPHHVTGTLPQPADRTIADRWILSRLNATIETVNDALASYDMDDATRVLSSLERVLRLVCGDG